jgi:hypothetical protein
LLSGALKKLVLWPIKKLIRKVVYVLAVKNCADVAAAVFHEGWLLARALEQGYIPLDDVVRGHKATIERLRDGILAAHEHTDPDVTRQVMRTSFGVGREVFGDLLDALRGIFKSEAGEDRIDAAEEEAAPIAERIMSELDEHWSLGPELDAALRTSLGVAPR